MHLPHATTLPPDNVSPASVVRLMIVDDAIDLMTTLKEIPGEAGYEAVGFTSGKAALAALQEQEFDLCLVDLMIPDMDGITLLKAAQTINPHLVGIMMTAQGTVETAVEAMKAGAYDYVVKPLKWQTLMQTLSRALDVRRLQEERQRQREALHQSAKLSAMSVLLAGVAHELNNPLSVVLGQTSLLSQLAADSPLAVRAEKISKAAERCARIIKNFLALARPHPLERQKVGLNQIIREAVELLAYPLRVDNVEAACDLSDALPTLWADPHQLQQDERTIIQIHPVVRAEMVKSMRTLAGVRPIIRHHHERYDGSGYPDGLRGDAIPLEARIMAVVDVYDALHTARPYKAALSHAHAVALLLRETEAGALDPQIVTTFLGVLGTLDPDAVA